MKNVILWAFLVSGAAWAAPVYKWVDAGGKVHYSDTPPPAGASLKQKAQPLKGGLVSSISTPNGASAPDGKQASIPASATAPAPIARNGAK